MDSHLKRNKNFLKLPELREIQNHCTNRKNGRGGGAGVDFGGAKLAGPASTSGARKLPSGRAPLADDGKHVPHRVVVVMQHARAREADRPHADRRPRGRRDARCLPGNDLDFSDPTHSITFIAYMLRAISRVMLRTRLHNTLRKS